MLKRAQLAVIHVAKKQTGMAEDEYRAMLSGFGVTSSKYLTVKDFKVVMRHFEKLGFVSTSASRYRPPQSKRRLVEKVQAILTDMSLPEAYVDGMSAHMFKNDDGNPITSWRWLNAGQLHKLVAALSYHQKRQSAR